MSFLKSAPKGSRIKSIEIDSSNSIRQPCVSAVDYRGKVNGVASFLKLETDVGTGRGLVRLLKDSQDNGRWKAFTLFTAMHELKGHEEKTKANRVTGVDHGEQPGRKNWQERRTATENFEGDKEPVVLILGTKAFCTSIEANADFLSFVYVRRRARWAHICRSTSTASSPYLDR